MARDPYRYFRIEARELFEQLSRDTLALEKETSPELVARLLRVAHTLKGAARVVKRPDIGDLAHGIEDVLTPLRDGQALASGHQIDALLRYLDQIDAALARLDEPAAAAPVPASSVTSAAVHAPAAAAAFAPIVEAEALQSVRVEIREVDRLLNGFGDVHAQLGALRQQISQIENFRELAAAVGAQLRLDALHGARRRDAQARLDQLHAAFDLYGRNVAADVEQLDRELRSVRTTAERMRLVPVDSLFVALERATRDAAQVYGKAVLFHSRGGDIRLDAEALVVVQAALSHAVRNAVVHGIESESARIAAGKPPAGQVRVEIAQRGKQLVFTCSDDGRGLDLDAIRAAARQRGVEAAQLQSDTAAVQALLRGGISTSATVTEVAGRGIGLDAIRDAAERLGGRVDLQSQAGAGTTLALTIPLSIAALEVLEVEFAGHIAALPLAAVRRSYRVSPGDIVQTAAGASLQHDGAGVPFWPLAQVTAVSQGDAAARHWSAVVIEAGGAPVALGVDRLRGTASVIVRPLPPLTPPLPLVAGVWLDADSQPQLVFDPAALVAAAQATALLVQPPPRLRAPILVIDDSLTTRMLERSILESAGYTVELAVSAEDALDKAAHNTYALFLVDVEMPGMDGFGFIERIRADPALREVPAILVTSRVSPEDLQRGEQVGANGHIAKGAFDQGEFLSQIRELVG